MWQMSSIYSACRHGRVALPCWPFGSVGDSESLLQGWFVTGADYLWEMGFLSMHRFGGIEKKWGGAVASRIGIENGGKPNPPSLHQKGAPPNWPQKHTGGSNTSAGVKMGGKGLWPLTLVLRMEGRPNPPLLMLKKKGEGFDLPCWPQKHMERV